MFYDVIISHIFSPLPYLSPRWRHKTKLPNTISIIVNTANENCKHNESLATTTKITSSKALEIGKNNKTSKELFTILHMMRWLYMPSCRLFSVSLTFVRHPKTTRAAKLILVNIVLPLKWGHQYDFLFKTVRSLQSITEKLMTNMLPRVISNHHPNKDPKLTLDSDNA